MDKPRPKFQFGLVTLLGLTAFAAFLLSSFTLLSRLWRTQRDLVAAQTSLAQSEKNAARRSQQLESEFFGIHGEPILAIMFRGQEVRSANPFLAHILNSKHHSQRSYWFNQSAGQFGFDLRLLRSLDGKDYYRLFFNPHANLKHDNSNASYAWKFDYVGKPVVISQSEEFVITLAPGRAASLESLLSALPSSEADSLRAIWQEPGRAPSVQTLFRPGVRPLNTIPQP